MHVGEELPATGPFSQKTTPAAVPPQSNFFGRGPQPQGTSHLELSGSIASNSTDDTSMTIDEMNVALCSKFQMACTLLTLIMLTLSWCYGVCSFVTKASTIAVIASVGPQQAVQQVHAYYAFTTNCIITCITLTVMAPRKCVHGICILCYQ